MTMELSSEIEIDLLRRKRKLDLDDERLLPYLSAYTRQTSNKGTVPKLHTGNWRDFARVHASTSISDKLLTLLKFVTTHSSRFGDIVNIDSELDYPLLDANSPEEINALLDDLVRRDYLRFSPTHNDPFGYSITIKGREYLDGATKSAGGHSQMASTIFYSWQSDLPNAINRRFIQTALERAARSIRNDASIHVEPVVDRDTSGVPGSPDIATTILEKIDNCDVFVCDVSIINSDQGQRPTPNPNVLFELGYALKRLGWGRIIMVLNAALGPVSDLPFDLRMKRVLVYSMQEGAADRSAERRHLEARLTSALQEIFRQIDRVDGEAATRNSLPPPHMEIVSPGSYLGRLDSPTGRFAVLLNVRFRNESEQPALIQGFRIQYAGKWHDPKVQAGSFSLCASSGRFAWPTTLGRQHDQITAHTSNGHD
jgi:hypothetical protein